jgi:penicillin-binding protein 1A
LEHLEREFPNHKLPDEIGLAEYSSAAQRLENEEAAFSWATNVCTILASGATYVALKLETGDVGANLDKTDLLEIKSAFFVLILFISFTSIVRLSYLTKKRVFAARKVIVIRRMLGVSYGENTLVLPNWRIEGADSPFSIHLYPGFFSNQALPVHLILLISSASIWLLWSAFIQLLSSFYEVLDCLNGYAALAIAVYYALSAMVFRIFLYDTHENYRLTVARIMARALRIKLVPNFELTMYHIKLSVAEAYRLKTDLVQPCKFAVFIEDKQFYEHGGINFQGIAGAFYRYRKTRKKSGGSSITQQFARSNFIIKPSLTIRRKLVEMALAKWINSVLTKDKLLDAYLCTVRFENGVYGIHNAYEHFFSSERTDIAPNEAFLLIERLGNIRGYFLGNRVSQLIKLALEAGLLTEAHVNDLLYAYKSSTNHHWHQRPDEKTPNDIALELLGSSLKMPQANPNKATPK